MNSAERREKRYQRRKAERDAKREEHINSIGTIEEVFSYSKMFKYGEDCCKGVMWKQSTQNFHQHLFSRTAVNRRNALNNKRPKKLHRFTIHERGKVREIEAPHIDDRQIQKTLTKEVLLPLYSPQIIYDNGASLKGKGLIFSQRQLDKALHEHINRYGYNGWIIVADYKGFFPNANRDIIKAKHQALKDKRLVKILDTITDIGHGDKGLPLGVEPSQIEMISLPSPIDNYMSCQLGLRGFGHYMDDYHIFVPPDRDPNDIMHKFIEICAKYDIQVSIDKTKIIPIGKPFKFCKMKRVFCWNKIVKRGCPDSIKRTRRKIKAYKKLGLKWEDVYTSLNSALSYFEQTNNHKNVLALRRLFYQIYGFSCENVWNFRKRD